MGNTKKLSDIIKDKKSEILKGKTRQILRPVIRGTFEEAKELFLLNCNEIFRKKRIKDEFVIDNINENAIDQVLYWAMGNDKFNGNLGLGILLRGGIGTGKTTILKAIIMIINEQLDREMLFSIHAKQLPFVVAEKGVGYFCKRKFLYDDIGKEPVEIKGNYGKVIYPLTDVIAEAYELGTWCMFTTNYTWKTLEDWYGETTTDRIKAMTNTVTLKGSSRRKETKI